jgi:hypothetical protein
MSAFGVITWGELGKVLQLVSSCFDSAFQTNTAAAIKTNSVHIKRACGVVLVCVVMPHAAGNAAWAVLMLGIAWVAGSVLVFLLAYCIFLGFKAWVMFQARQRRMRRAQNRGTASNRGSSKRSKRSSQRGCKAAAANSSRTSSSGSKHMQAADDMLAAGGTACTHSTADAAVLNSSSDGEIEEDDQSIKDLLALLPASRNCKLSNKPKAVKGALPDDAAVRVVVTTPPKAVTSKVGAASKVAVRPAGAAAIPQPTLTDYTAAVKGSDKRAPRSNKAPGEAVGGVGCGQPQLAGHAGPCRTGMDRRNMSCSAAYIRLLSACRAWLCWYRKASMAELRAQDSNSAAGQCRQCELGGQGLVLAYCRFGRYMSCWQRSVVMQEGRL